MRLSFFVGVRGSGGRFPLTPASFCMNQEAVFQSLCLHGMCDPHDFMLLSSPFPIDFRSPILYDHSDKTLLPLPLTSFFTIHFARVGKIMKTKSDPNSDLNKQDEIIYFNLVQGLFFAYSCAYICLHHYWAENIFFGGKISLPIDISLAAVGTLFSIVILIYNRKNEPHKATRIACYVCAAYCFMKLIFLSMSYFLF